MKTDPIRRRAWEVLRDFGAGAPLDPTLDAALDAVDEPRSRSFLAELVKGAIRWRGRYDAVIQAFLRHPRRSPDAKTREVLRLGLHQLISCDGVPAYAAVDQSVRLARAVCGARTAPFVNGLLQSAARHLAAADVPADEALLPLYPDPVTDPAGHIAARHSHPRWLVERWLDRFGMEGCADLCARDNAPPPLCVRVLEPVDPAAATSRLAAAGLEPRASGEDPRCLVLDAPPVRRELARVLAGEPGVIVQDAAVQEATAWLGRGCSGRVVDLCAAPGGKAFHLRAAVGKSGSVVAMDVSAARLGLVRETSDRMGGAPLPLLVGDAMMPPLKRGSCDAVLLDGPCTGTGVLRRHPEGRWLVSPRSIERSGARLRDLAVAAADLVRPGGLLLYCTCSLEPEENEAVVAHLLAGRPDFAAEAPGDPDRRWLPQRDGADGFYAARLRRREGCS